MAALSFRPKLGLAVGAYHAPFWNNSSTTYAEIIHDVPHMFMLLSPHTAPPDLGVLVHNRLSDYSSIRFLKLVIVSADIPQPVVAKL